MKADVEKEHAGLTDDIRQLVRAVGVAANVIHKCCLCSRNGLVGILGSRGDRGCQGGMWNLNHTTRISFSVMQLKF